jgi:tRNA pseudouridine32 synthase / 23S rRNA pseudouridine746 synthase
MRPLDEHGRSAKEAVSPLTVSWALRRFVLLWLWIWSASSGGGIHGLLLPPHPVATTTTTTTTTVNAVSAPPAKRWESSSAGLVDPYMLERNVTIRSVSWDTPSHTVLSSSCTGDSTAAAATALLQIYHGAAVAPVPKQLHDRTTQSSIQTLFAKLDSAGGDVDAVIQQSAGLDLSHSSRSRLEQWPSLGPTARDQLRSKIAVEARATQSIDPAQVLHILYVDEHICVVNKPSGVLAVPGSRRNPSLATTVFDLLQPYHTLDNMDQMVVHRIDMDTSGILVFALTVPALQQLHYDFRERRVQKSYTALLAGHYRTAEITEIDVALERDPDHPPFMRIAQPKEPITTTTLSTTTTYSAVPTNHKRAVQKFLNAAPKPSWTELHVQSLEYIGGDLPVTRVQLVPHTGRTHQLRVHTAAALGFPIVGDDIYGFAGEGRCGSSSSSIVQDPEHPEIQRQLYELKLPLCLHAHRLTMFHPISRAPMVFQCDAYF